ncbi:MAG: hypothetical protein ACREJ9_04050 [Candidatus Rokuibacteriota bacterium]
MSLADPELTIRRFTVSELRRMKERGILPPQARIELLDGLLVDLPRPSARKIEVVRRLADLLAGRLGAPVQGGEPIHPRRRTAHPLSASSITWSICCASARATPSSA